MAVQNRANNQTTIDTNIPDNTTELITPALDREARTNLNDSMFNKLDEPRDVIQTTAFVYDGGNDLTANMGDMSQPYASIQTAVDAVPSTGGVVYVLAGSFIESIDVSNKNQLKIVMIGITLTGNILFTDSFDCELDLGASRVTGLVNLGASLSKRNSLKGGFIGTTDANTSLVLGEGSIVWGTQVTSTGTGRGVGSANNDPDERAFVTNCRIVSNNNTGIYRCQGVTFDTCYIEGNIGVETNNNIDNNELSKFINCITVGRTGAGLTGESGVVQAEFEGGYIVSNASMAISMALTSDYAMFNQVKIIGATDCVVYGNNLTRAAGVSTVFDACRFYAGSGNIFNEGTYASDNGTTEVINCTFNKAYVGSGAPRYFEYNTTTIVGLQTPVI